MRMIDLPNRSDQVLQQVSATLQRNVCIATIWWRALAERNLYC